jgi:hypothetical protein
MILIDYPFVSEFLRKTILEKKFGVVSTNAAKELLQDGAYSWISEKEAARRMKEKPGTPLYTNSENALNWISKYLGDTPLSKKVELFKNKVQFRELIRPICPNFFFKEIKLEDIQHLHSNQFNYPFVIKPSVGFFSIGVHVIRNQSEWEAAIRELNPEKLRTIYPLSVIDTSTFIIEEYIDGEEFAVDCYFNHNGEIVILNILLHKFSSGADTSDRVYTTSLEIIHLYKDRFGKFLQSIGSEVGLINFPAHVELRIDSKGVIIPIEINPLRFGGWCTTADLLGIATGFSPYHYYLQNQRPDWEEVFKGRSSQKFSLIVLNNNSGYTADQIELFDYDLLERDFNKPLLIRKMDVNKYPLFGFVFAETSPGNEAELDNILVSNLRKYIILKGL